MNYLRGIFSIFKKDFRGLFVGPLFYVLCGLGTLILSGNFLYSTSNFLEQSQMGAQAMMMGQQPQEFNIREFLFIGHYVMYFWLLFFIVAAMAIKFIAEEKRNHTFDLLWTAPVTPLQIILGKYFAATLALFVLTVLTFFYPLATWMFATMEWGALFASFVGLFLIAATFVAIGMFVSSLSTSAVITVVGSVVIYFGLLLVGWMERAFDGMWWAQSFFGHLSIATHMEAFLKGTIQLSSLVFLVSFSAFWLFLAEGTLKFSAVNVSDRKLHWSSKYLLGVGFLCVIVPAVFGWILKFWPDWFWFPLGVAAVAFTLMAVVERKFLLSFFSSKAAAKDISVGSFLVLSVLLLGVVNYIAVKNDHLWDLTEGKINTLSPQSAHVLEGLENPLTVVALYQDDNSMRELDARLKPLVDLYQNTNPGFVRYERYNVLQRPELIEIYGLTQQDPLAVFVTYGDAREKVNSLDETAITTAIARVKDNEVRAIYVITGHGEAQLSERGPQGLSRLSSELERMRYRMETLDLREREEIPSDASFVAIWGPRTDFAEGEIERLREYIRGGGRVFMAADPLERHGLAQLTKTFGIEFANTVILNDQARRLGYGPTHALGLIEPGGHEIASRLPNVPNMFVKASPLREVSEEGSPWRVTSLVRTPNEVVAQTSFGPTAQLAGTGRMTIAAISEKVSEAPDENSSDGKDLQALLVVGDSSFITNQFILQGNNENLAKNMVYYLSRNQQIMGVEPKRAVGTVIAEKTTYYRPLFFGLIGFIPIFFLGGGVTVWLRRRTA